jgi:hypothetical protein
VDGDESCPLHEQQQQREQRNDAVLEAVGLHTRGLTWRLRTTA